MPNKPTTIKRSMIWSAAVFSLWACSPSTGAGCEGTSYVYPRGEPGKQVTENAASVRINQEALDFVAEHLPDLIEGLCCDATAATSREEAAMMCWAKAPCFLEKLSNNDKRINFYLGSPGAPMYLTGNTNDFNIELRNGDPFSNPASADGAYVISGIGTGELSERPYCNDTGGDVCQRQVANLQRFCQTSDGPGSQVCNNANPSDPSQRDYCCGDDAHGILWNTEPLDICDNDRVMPRCTGYPSSIGLFTKQLTAQNLRLVPVDESGTLPAGIAVSLSNLDLGLDLHLALQNTGITDFACGISDADPALGTIRNASLAFTMRPKFNRLTPESPATLTVCEDCLTIDDFSLDLQDPSIYADKPDRLCQDENWPLSAEAECSAACTLADGSVGLFSWIFNGVGGLIDLLKEPIGKQIAKLVAAQLEGIPVGMSMQVDLKRLLRDTVKLRYGEPLGVLGEAHGAGLSVRNIGPAKGLIAGVDFGLESNGSVCVRPIAPPSQDVVADPELEATVTVLDNTQTPPKPRNDVYHVGVALSKVALERVMYTTFHSGLLCLGLGTDDLYQLTNGSQKITAGLLFLLAPELEKLADADAPIMFQIEPQSPPEVTFGTGLPTGRLGPNGAPEIDSLLQVDIRAMRLSFYLFTQQQMVRLFSVQADLHVGLSIQRQADNTLALSIDSLRTANLQTVFSDLVTRDFSQVVDTLFGIATSALLTNNLSFKLDFDSLIADALNAPVYVRINDIQRAGANKDFIAAYATMCDARNPRDTVCKEPPPPAPVRDALLAVPTFLDDSSALYRTPDVALPATLRAEVVPTGMARIHVSNSEHQNQLEYTAIVDSGTPTTLALADDAGDLWISSPWLKLPGRHQVRIMAQQRAAYATLATIGEAVIEVDADRPLVTLTPGARGANVVVTAKDSVSTSDELRLEAAITTGQPGAEWMPVANGQTLALRPGETLQARATDHAGRVSEVVSFAVPKDANRASSKEFLAAMRSGCGCHSTDTNDLAVWALVLWMFGRYTRRRF